MIARFIRAEQEDFKVMWEDMLKEHETHVELEVAADKISLVRVEGTLK